MGKVTAVHMAVTTDKSGHVAVGMAPSVCTTPAAPSPIPVPYPVTSSSAEGCIKPAMRTKIEGAKVITVGSDLKACHGNEPGTLKEVVSLNTGGPTFMLVGAPTVFVEMGMQGITGSPGMKNRMMTGGGSGSASSAGGGAGGGGGGGGGAGGGGGGGPSGPGGGGGAGGGTSTGASAKAPTPAERAKEPNANPDDGLNAAREKARRNLAESFYKEKYPWMSDDKRNSHLRGIDYSKPVEVVSVPPPPKLGQHMWPANNPKPGNYFAPEGSTPTSLGINHNGVNNDTGKVEPKPYGTFAPPASQTPALKSTAAPIIDDWSDPANPYQTRGGGTQYNIPDKGSMRPL